MIIPFDRRNEKLFLIFQKKGLLFPSGCAILNERHRYAPLAQLDRVSGYGPEGQGFESLTACQKQSDRHSAVGFFVFLLNSFCAAQPVHPAPPPENRRRHAELSDHDLIDHTERRLQHRLQCRGDRERAYGFKESALSFHNAPPVFPLYCNFREGEKQRLSA